MKRCARCGVPCSPAIMEDGAIGGWYMPVKGEGPLCFPCAQWASVEFGVVIEP